MERRIEEIIDGWKISLDRNVHMYTHDLSVEKGNSRISIDCEDLPTQEKTIGIWLHNLDVSDTLKKELQDLLVKWTKKLDVKFKIYLKIDEFVTNRGSA